MASNKLFVYEKTKNNTDYYTVNDNYEVEIKAIDIESGDIAFKSITKYTVHHDLEMYEIKDKNNRFKPFYASSDHSLIVYSKKTHTLEKISPLDIIQNPENYFLIQQIGDKIRKINCRDIIITHAPNIKDAGDFTVKDYYTFCTADGVFVQDTLALYTPITAEAQREVKEKMIGSYINTGTGSLGYTPSQDIVLGIYVLTKDIKNTMYTSTNTLGDIPLQNIPPSKFDYDFDTRIKYKGVRGEAITSYGRYLVTMLFPKQVLPNVIDTVITKKELTNYISQSLKYLNKHEFAILLTKITELAGKALKIYPISSKIDELIVPKELKSLVKKVLLEEDLVSATYKLQNIIMPKLKSFLKKVDSGMYHLVESGAKGSWGDIEQILLAKGFVSDNTGKILKEPIIRNFIDGLLPSDIQKMGVSVIKGSADRSLNTRETGSLLRILSFALSTVQLSKIEDCKTKKYLEFKVDNEHIAKSLRYKYVISNKYTGYITDENYKVLIGQQVKVRSPMYCLSKDVCKKCYGLAHNVLKSKHIGTLAAMSLGERGSQLMMKTFHLSKVNVKQPVNIYEIWSNKIPLTQVQDVIYAKEDIIIILDNKIVQFTYTEDNITIKQGILEIYTPTEEKYALDLAESDIPFGIEVTVIPENIDVTDTGLMLKFRKNEQIGTIQYITVDMSTQIKQLKAYLYGKDIDNPEELYHKFSKMYAPLGLLSVHYELLVMNMTRLKENPFRLWRFEQEKPYQIVSIKQIPFLESPLVGIGFENIEKATEQAIIAEQLGVGFKASPVEKLLIAATETDINISDLF